MIAGCNCCVCQGRHCLAPHPGHDHDFPTNKMAELTKQLISRVMEQREEILEAFLAKHGCDPSEIIQCGTRDGKWFVRRMTPEEIKFRDKVQTLAQPPLSLESVRDDLGERFRGRTISVSKTAWKHGTYPLTNHYMEYVISIQPGLNGLDNQNFGGNSLQECLTKFNQAAPELPDITGCLQGNINRPEIP